MNRNRKIFSIIFIVLLVLACTFSLTACLTFEPLDEIEDDGNISNSNTDNSNIPTDNNGNSYDVTTQVGTPSNTATSLTEVVSAIQTSVVIINTDVGAGSGVIYGKVNGENASMIVTCCHVIDGASQIKVTINDGDTDSENDVILDATLVGMDDESDLAVLKISGSDYNYVELRNTEEAPIILAEQAIAIGNPLGAGISVTVGHISGISKTINMDGFKMTLLQTDAAVNSGNSGGALFDAEGYLIGIVNAKSIGESVEGMGYAIPVYDVINICNSFIKTTGNASYNGLGYIEGKIRLGVSVLTCERAYLSNSKNTIYINNSQYLPANNNLYYCVSSINEYGSVAISDTNKQIYASTTANLLFITAVTYPENGQNVKKYFNSDFELTNFLKNANVGDNVTLHMLEQVETVSGSIFTGYTSTYAYREFNVNVTLQQYVYGYKG